jgi:hypothetical protein
VTIYLRRFLNNNGVINFDQGSEVHGVAEGATIKSINDFEFA